MKPNDKLKVTSLLVSKYMIKYVDQMPTLMLKSDAWKEKGTEGPTQKVLDFTIGKRFTILENVLFLQEE